MKKFFTLLSCIALTTAANAQTYLSDDWTGGTLTSNNAWTTYTTDMNFDWGTQDLGSPGNFYAYMTNWNGSNNAVTAWLISPVMDFSSAVQPEMEFRNAYNFAGAPLELHISTDYPGTGDPGTNGTWTDITGSATWSAGGFAWTNSGVIDLSAYNGNAAVYIAFRYEGSATDGSTWEVDEVNIAEYTPTPQVSIYDVQYTLSDPAVSPYNGDSVTVSGVVTSPSQDASGVGYFIQDADGSWNGLCINDATNTPSIGDSVTVTVMIEENFGFTRGLMGSYTNHGPSTWTPTEVTITAASASSMEEYESVLVLVQGVECTSDNIGNGLWEGHDGTDTLVVDDDCFNNDAVLGNWYDITGVMSYSFSQYKINPRNGSSDLAIVGYAGVDANENSINIYPNPAENTVFVYANPTAVVNIYSMTGALVANGVGNQIIDVSNLESGIYQLVVTENGSNISKKLMIK